MRPTTLRYDANQSQFSDALTTPSPGGAVIQYAAGGNLNVGDVVILTGGAFIVNKATAGTTSVVGVVIGGDSMPDKGIWESTENAASDRAAIAAGILAAVAGQKVFVQTYGVCYVTAGAAIAQGAQVVPSTVVAGRIMTVAADPSVIIGKLIDAAAAANGDVRLIYLNV